MIQDTRGVRVFIAGGTGLIGRRLCAAWRARGAEVLVGTRTPTRSPVEPGVRFLSWRYPLEAAVRQEIASCDVVYNFVGENIGARRWSSAQREELRRSRIASTRQLVEALSSRTTVFLNASAVSAYPGDGKAYPEGEVLPLPEESSFIHQMTREWEAEASKADPRTVILRIGVVLGERGMLEGVLPLFRWRVARYMGAPDTPVPWVDIRDVTRILMFLAEDESAVGAFNLVAPTSTRFEEFSRALQLALGIESWAGLPPWLVKLVLGRDASALVLARYAVEPQRLLAHGFRFEHTDLAESLRHALETRLQNDDP